MKLPGRRGRVVVGLVAPFVLLPLLARLAIGPIADAMASAFGKMAPAPSSFVAAADPTADPEDDVEELAPPVERRSGSGELGPRRVARWVPPVSSARTDGGAAKSGGTIVVPASVIEKAIQDKKKPSARDVVDADGKPFGAKLHGVSRYKVGLQDGDIIIEVAGTRVHSMSEIIQAGTQAVAAGTSRIAGKIVRGDATYDVVLEIPKPPQP